MQPRDRQTIEHILNYCSEIQAATERFGKDYQTFSADNDYHDVVAFRILQIGELAGNLSEELRAATSGEVDWRQIKAMRNIVAHHYGKIELEIVWDVAIHDIPVRKAFCEKLI